MKLDDRLIQKLTASGFSDKAATIYVALLELGGAYPSRIAQITGINRSTVYHTLTQLSVQGLVNEIRKGKKLYYEAEAPKALERFGDMQVRIAQEQKERLESLLHDVAGLFQGAGHKPKVRFFSGKDEIRSMYADHVDTDTPYHMVGWSNTGSLTDFFPASFMQWYVKKKQKIGITSQGIFPETERDRAYNSTVYKHIRGKFTPERRFIPAVKFPYRGEITVYGQEKVSFMNIDDTSRTGVIIEDAGIHDMMKMIFDLSWFSATE